MIFTAQHDLSKGPSPWSVFVTFDGVPVLDGGPYPNENPASIVVLENSNYDQATSVASSLARVFSTLGIESTAEEIADA
jgi:hypothetical protein